MPVFDVCEAHTANFTRRLHLLLGPPSHLFSVVCLSVTSQPTAKFTLSCHRRLTVADPQPCDAAYLFTRAPSISTTNNSPPLLPSSSSSFFHCHCTRLSTNRESSNPLLRSRLAFTLLRCIALSRLRSVDLLCPERVTTSYVPFPSLPLPPKSS